MIVRWIAVIALLCAAVAATGIGPASSAPLAEESLDRMQQDCRLAKSELGLAVGDLEDKLGLSEESRRLTQDDDSVERYGLAVTAEDADRLDGLSAAFDKDRSGQVHKVAEASVDGFTAMWVDYARGGYVLSATSDVAKLSAADLTRELGLSAPVVEIVRSKNSKVTLDRTMESLRANGAEMYQAAKLTFGVTDLSCGLHIFNSEMDASEASSILAKFLDPSTFYVSPVKYRTADRNKGAKADPHLGGVNIRPTYAPSGTFCSTNNVWLKGTEKWIVTAGHCIGSSSYVNQPANPWDVFTTHSLHWYQGPSNTTANQVSQYTLQYSKYQGGTDVLLIQDNGARSYSDDFHWNQDNFYPYTTHIKDTYGWVSAVAADQWPWLGEMVCTSGAGANAPYCGDLYSLNVMPPQGTDLGFTTWFHDMLGSHTYGCGGDSGAGGYYEVTVNGQKRYYLTGIVKGGPGSPCGPDTYYSSVGWMFRETGLTKPYGL